MLEGLPYVAILLLLLLLLLVLFLILLFIFLLCASRLSTRQSKVDGTLVFRQSSIDRFSKLEVPGIQEIPASAARQLKMDGTLVSLLTKLDRNSGPGYAVGVPFCTEGDSLCVVVSRACCPLPLPMKTVCTQPLIVTACPGIKYGGPEFCWLSLPVSASVMSPLKWNAA